MLFGLNIPGQSLLVRPFKICYIISQPEGFSKSNDTVLTLQSTFCLIIRSTMSWQIMVVLSKLNLNAYFYFDRILKTIQIYFWDLFKTQNTIILLYWYYYFLWFTHNYSNSKFWMYFSLPIYRYLNISQAKMVLL